MSITVVKCTTVEPTPYFEILVRNLRLARNWSQETLAERCGWSASKQSGIETARVHLDTRETEYLARALDCTFFKIGIIWHAIPAHSFIQVLFDTDEPTFYVNDDKIHPERNV